MRLYTGPTYSADVTTGTGTLTLGGHLNDLARVHLIGGAIVPNMTVTSLSGRVDFATVRGSNLGFEVVALEDGAYKTDINAAGPGDNVRLGADTHTLTSSRAIHSLILEDNAVLNGSGCALTVTGANSLAGLILGNNTQINVETLILGAQAFVTVPEGATATITSVIRQRYCTYPIFSGSPRRVSSARRSHSREWQIEDPWP